MVLNADKTKSILITGKHLKSQMQLSSLALTASDSNIELVSSQKLLGVIIDEHLTFKEHINKHRKT
jgi:small ligand-binding sensory domain FIST